MEFSEQLLASLRRAERVVVLTGAGISAESGVPTFRDALTGLWANFKPEDLATPQAFLRNPAMVWNWYAVRRAMVSKVQPNNGHAALAALEKRISRLTLVTQNVDDLHRRAGSRRVLELHGNLMRTKCFEEDVVVDAWPETGEVPPRCPRCGGLLRPDVVWFGEPLPAREMQQAVEDSRACNVFLSIGTSGMVYPAASLPFEALQCGAFLIEINLEETPLTPHAAASVRGPSGVVLPALLRALWPTS